MASQTTKRRVQWAYLVVSALLVLALLPLVKGLYGSQALSVVFFVILSAYLVWLAPRRWIRGFFWYASPLVKIGVTLNVLSGLMLLELAIERWWGRAVTFATLFVIALVGGYILHRLVIPVAYWTYLIFLRGESTDIGPEQTRRIRPD